MLRTAFRYPAIRPLIPPPSRWLPYLETSYEARWYSNFGPLVRQFESALTDKFCYPGEQMKLAASGTTAIAGALIAMGVRGTVLIPAFSFPATAAGVVMAGAHPCVLDVDPMTWTFSTDLLASALRNHPCECVILVVPFGIARDFEAHFEICQRHDVSVLIDNAAGLGAKTVPLPSDRCMEVYSMHATKPFAIGEGGAIRAPKSQEMALHRALNFGLLGGEPFPGSWGINGKMPEISAAVGLAVLEDMEDVLGRRIAAAARYLEIAQAFDDLLHPSFIDRAPWQTFPIAFPRPAMADTFISTAAARGLEIRRGYHPGLEDWPGTSKIARCPNSRSLTERMGCLPIYSDATEQEIADMVEIASEALTGAAAM